MLGFLALVCVTGIVFLILKLIDMSSSSISSMGTDVSLSGSMKNFFAEDAPIGRNEPNKLVELSDMNTEVLSEDERIIQWAKENGDNSSGSFGQWPFPNIPVDNEHILESGRDSQTAAVGEMSDTPQVFSEHRVVSNALKPIGRDIELCRSCGHHICRRAKTCPQCGCPDPSMTELRSKGMIAIFSFIFLFGCCFIPMMLGLGNRSSSTRTTYDTSNTENSSPYWKNDEERLEWRSRHNIPQMTDEDIRYEQRKLLKAYQKIKASENPIGR